MALSNNKVVYISFLIASLCLVGMYFFNQRNSNNEQVTPQTSSTSILLNVNAIEFTKDGVIERHLKSPQIAHHAKTFKNTINFPIIHITKNDKPWKITADKAILTKHNTKIRLEGHVNISQFDNGNKVSQLLTSKLFYYPKTQQVYTSKKITYINQGTTIYSQGLKADLNKETVELVSKARGIHEKSHS